MTTPILRPNPGTPVVATASALGSTLASTATMATYSSAIRVQNTGNFLLADVWLAGSFGSSPGGVGALQLFAMARDPAGTIGPTPSSTVIPKLLGAFTPTPSGTGHVTYFLGAVPIPWDCDLYIVNNSDRSDLHFPERPELDNRRALYPAVESGLVNERVFDQRLDLA